MLVSQNSRLSFGVSKLDSFKARVLFRFCLITQPPLSLPNLSRKIEGPLLAGHKLINNNFLKDNIILSSKTRFGYSDQSCQSYTHEKGNIFGEKSTANFAVYILLFKD